MRPPRHAVFEGKGIRALLGNWLIRIMFLSVADNRSMGGPATPSCLCTVVQPAVEWDSELEFGGTGGISSPLLPAELSVAPETARKMCARARKRASLIISFRVLSSLCPPRQAHARASPSEAMLRQPG